MSTQPSTVDTFMDDIFAGRAHLCPVRKERTQFMGSSGSGVPVFLFFSRVAGMFAKSREQIGEHCATRGGVAYFCGEEQMSVLVCAACDR